MHTTKEPGHQSRSTTLRGGVVVDVELQKLRITNHCYKSPITTWEPKLILLSSGETEVRFVMKEEPRCPDNHCECEIFQDHSALGLEPAILPCKGALVPGERIRIGNSIEFVEEVEALENLIATLNSDDILKSHTWEV